MSKTKPIPRTRATLWLLGPLLSTLSACGGAPEPARQDLLLITVDTLRPDYLGSYGHPRATTPALDALARDGVLFEQHFATVPQTAPSHATMFTGLHPREHGLRKNGIVLSPELPSLPSLLSEDGWQTAAVIAFPGIDSTFGFDRGFDRFDETVVPEYIPGEPHVRYSRPAEAIADQAIAQIQASDPDAPLFLWVHFYDPHAPYKAPVRSGLDRAEGRELLRDRIESGPLHNESKLLGRHLNYEDEVAYTSRHIERILQVWDGQRGADRGVVVLTADHGEGLGEHDLIGHGFYLYEEQLHVPMILRAPASIPAGVRVESPTSAVDLPATLLALVGLDVPAGALPGEDLTRLWTDPERVAEGTSIVAERPLYSAFDLTTGGERPALLALKDGGVGGSRGEQISLRIDRWKYIWSADVPPELYDLETDPLESVNLAESQPKVLAACQERLDRWLRTRRNAVDSEVRDDAEVERMLRALGY